MKTQMNRRKFLGGAAASAAAFTVVPRHVLGGAGNVAPSEKITFAYVGCGTQGLREMMGLLAMPELRIVAVCDPEKDGVNYVDWSRDGLRSEIARALEKPDWRKGGPIPGGREVAKEIVETYYAKGGTSDRAKGCTAYADFRELLEKADGIDAVKVITPDHLHATVAIAAMKKGKHVMMHKPLANRQQEARLVVETARRTKVGTYFQPAGAGEQVKQVANWIRAGAIGTLREIHNWSFRPVWPQYATLPTDQPAVPKDFDWDLWLGPSLPRPYHPHYTHAVFRGWYEFGGGSIADMGHYSLWPVFREFGLDNLAVVESTPSHVCAIENSVSRKIANDFAFPFASTIRFKFAAKSDRPAVDLFWYDGGMRPVTPPEVEEDNKELASEGMMFVGDQGKILGGFRCEDPRIIPERKAREFGQGAAAAQSQERSRGRGGRDAAWVQTFKGGAANYGDFTLGGPISDAFNLGAVSLRLGGKRLVWDTVIGKVTNLPAANKCLTREYRKGWELTA
ncbi:MAG: Gfo/Idh/MocA family oxidoreductase [Planctomycetes bacterium]|nr:Gfo/Idh/MocA family oxidoreductase [Planctomycetota bacterium]